MVNWNPTMRLASRRGLKLDRLEEVPFRFKQKNVTKAACFHGQHFSCLEGI